MGSVANCVQSLQTVRYPPAQLCMLWNIVNLAVIWLPYAFTAGDADVTFILCKMYWLLMYFMWTCCGFSAVGDIAAGYSGLLHHAAAKWLGSIESSAGSGDLWFGGCVTILWVPTLAHNGWFPTRAGCEPGVVEPKHYGLCFSSGNSELSVVLGRQRELWWKGVVPVKTDSGGLCVREIREELLVVKCAYPWQMRAAGERDSYKVKSLEIEPPNLWNFVQMYKTAKH